MYTEYFLINPEYFSRMAIFLVDLQFREKAKQMLTSRELMAVVLFLLFALLPWVEIMETARVVGNGTWWRGQEDGEPGSLTQGMAHCNPHTKACV